MRKLKRNHEVVQLCIKFKEKSVKIQHNYWKTKTKSEQNGINKLHRIKAM
jgi:hypothetical protein